MVLLAKACGQKIARPHENILGISAMNHEQYANKEIFRFVAQRFAR